MTSVTSRQRENGLPGCQAKTGDPAWALEEALGSWVGSEVGRVRQPETGGPGSGWSPKPLLPRTERFALGPFPPDSAGRVLQAALPSEDPVSPPLPVVPVSSDWLPHLIQ